MKVLPTRLIRVTERNADGRISFRFNSEVFSDWVEIFLLLLASAIYISSMYLLYAVNDMEVRFAIIGAFTMVFVFTIRLLTPTDTINILTAMAA